ncbi:hypothetical protein FisN_10Hh339 [Fistulifera solaris]|uniref:Uncharacterized protein n=1 Tax=Fistulifera solaris TaxID=1519565 RepID=A0A1Z5JR36_FISSO|nr:hypothetical protein FisN_10Hh339 [Fistulifera solaris]|eukprot:GAX16419.1 hypothetical protein FisN_10Hh339 [Fistulifera solaris]
MKYLPCLFIIFIHIRIGHAAAPPTLTIGDVNDAGTEFNVGEGNTDETGSYNHIQIVNTAGLDLGLMNNPGPSPAAETKYYEFTILAPGCLTPGDGVVTVKASYDTDGHFTGANTVDLELTVAAWGASNHAVDGRFGVCIQADIMMITKALQAVVIERKNFDFRVTPILSTFTINAGMTDSTVSVGGSDGEKSGTTVTGTWAGNNPLAPGDPIWFILDIVSPTYSFVGFEEVSMAVGVQPVENLVVDSEVQDTAMTGSDLYNADTELQFYHILPRSVYTGDPQQLEMSGKAIVTYTGRRRLENGEYKKLTENADFSLKASLMTDDGSGSSSFKLEVLSIVIGGVGVIGGML